MFDVYKITNGVPALVNLYFKCIEIVGDDFPEIVKCLRVNFVSRLFGYTSVTGKRRFRTENGEVILSFLELDEILKKLYLYLESTEHPDIEDIISKEHNLRLIDLARILGQKGLFYWDRKSGFKLDSTLETLYRATVEVENAPEEARHVLPENMPPLRQE